MKRISFFLAFTLSVCTLFAQRRDVQTIGTVNEGEIPVKLSSAFYEAITYSELKNRMQLNNVPNLTLAQMFAEPKTLTNTTFSGADGTGNIISYVPTSALASTSQFNPRQTFAKALNSVGFHAKIQSFGMNFGDLNTTNVLTDGRLNLTLVVPDWADTMRYVSYYQATVGNYTADGENRLGIYLIDTITCSCTLVASTANNGDQWKSAVGIVNVPLTAAYVMPAGQPYYIVSLYNSSAQTTQPAIWGSNNTASSTVVIGACAGFRLTNAHTSAQSTLPASFNLSSTTSVAQRYWYKLY